MTHTVLFDSQVFVTQSRGGVSRYHAELAAALRSRGRYAPVVHAGLHFAELPPPSVLPRLGASIHLPGEAKGTRPMQALNRALVPRRRAARTTDLYHPTWYDQHMIDRFGDLPLVITLHDLIPEQWPEVTNAAQLADRAAAIDRADGIVCVSESTRQRLVERFPAAARKAAVTPLGLPSYARGSHPEPAVSPAPARPYAVYVGNRSSYKNFAVLARALRHTPDDLQVVAVGGGEINDATRGLLDGLGVADRLIHRAHPSDAELRSLLRGAIALVSPSLEEGFGLPPLEALANGCPVVLSDIPVYREVYGAWGEFFDPHDEMALADALQAALDGDVKAPVPADLAERFSWDITAARTEDVYAHVLGSAH